MPQQNSLFSRPLRVGSLTLPSSLALAPMAGLGHVAYREVLGRFGGVGFMVTEMCNARAVPQESRHHSPVFRWRDEEAFAVEVKLCPPGKRRTRNADCEKDDDVKYRRRTIKLER